VHPEQDAKYWHEYRTLAKVQSLDYAYEALLRTMVSAEIDSTNTDVSASASAASASSGSIFALTNEIWKHRPCPSYGRTSSSSSSSSSATKSPSTTAISNRDNNDPQSINHSNNQNNNMTAICDLIPGITARGAMAHQRVLMALERVVLGMVEYAPLLPVICALLLMSMSESYAFTAIREMAHVRFFFVIIIIILFGCFFCRHDDELKIHFCMLFVLCRRQCGKNCQMAFETVQHYTSKSTRFVPLDGQVHRQPPPPTRLYRTRTCAPYRIDARDGSPLARLVCCVRFGLSSNLCRLTHMPAHVFLFITRL
jgi:hypothetical protein